MYGYIENTINSVYIVVYRHNNCHITFCIYMYLPDLCIQYKHIFLNKVM